MSGDIDDTLFRSAGSNPAACADIYHGLTGKVVDPSEVEINTLARTPLSSKMNDLSFRVRGQDFVILEHQSTFSPNIPMRILLYYARLIEQRVLCEKESRAMMYSRRAVKMEPPQFYVLATSEEKYFGGKRMRLSEVQGWDNSDIEVSVTVLVGESYACLRSDFLSEFFLICKRIRGCRKLVDSVDEAVRLGYNIARGERALKFFGNLSEEDIDMLSRDMISEEEREAIASVNRKEGREEGRKEGLEEGREKERAENIRNFLRAGATIKFITEALGVTEEDVRKMGIDPRTGVRHVRMVDGMEILE